MFDDHNNGGTGGGGQLSLWEELTMLSLGMSVAAALLTVATWKKLLNWLVDQHVLVAAKHQPLLELPAGAGIGIDLPRLAIAAAGLVFALVCAVAAIRRHTDREERGWSGR